MDDTPLPPLRRRRRDGHGLPFLRSVLHNLPTSGPPAITAVVPLDDAPPPDADIIPLWLAPPEVPDPSPAAEDAVARLAAFVVEWSIADSDDDRPLPKKG